MELKGHNVPSDSTIFDDVFTDQVIEHGKIEDGEVLQQYLKKSGQPLMQDWIVQMVKQMIKGLPVLSLIKQGWATIFHPKTKNWSAARDAIKEHIEEEHAAQREALGLDTEK